MTTTGRRLRVRTIRYEAPDVISIELVDPDPGPEVAALDRYRAGAHVDLGLPNGLSRSYSLFQPSDGRSYWVAVLRDRNSTGGSAWIHERLRPGMMLPITAPSNNFPVADHSAPSLLIAGGIGITPVLAQFRELIAAGNRDLQLVYGARSRSQAPFVAEIEELARAGGSGVTARFHFDDEAGGPPDLTTLIEGRPDGVHLYCCGPTPMLDAFEAACADHGVADDRWHVERFSAVEVGPADDAQQQFEVELQASGITLELSAGESILTAVRAAGVDAPHSCREGVCGSCEVDVIDGLPDHRDGVLSPSEKETNETMMICVSGSRSPRLVIDL